MLVNELKEELNQPLTNMEVKVEIGSQKSYAGSAYIDKGGCLVINRASAKQGMMINFVFFH